mgnify:CR=1 FL=1
MRPQTEFSLFEVRSEDSKSKTFDYSVSQSYHEVETKPVIGDKFFQMPDDIRSQNNIGIFTDPMLMSLPCRSVEDANGKLNLGELSHFNSSSMNVKPFGWSDPLAFVQDRNGFSHNYKQPALTLNTWKR